jgi:hypothetical protein
MATVSPPAPARSVHASQGRLRSPLDRLRSYIRGYVFLEGVFVFLLFVILWFWIGLALDYGFFKGTQLLGGVGVDWLGVAPLVSRGGLLALLLAGCVIALFLLGSRFDWRGFLVGVDLGGVVALLGVAGLVLLLAAPAYDAGPLLAWSGRALLLLGAAGAVLTGWALRARLGKPFGLALVAAYLLVFGIASAAVLKEFLGVAGVGVAMGCVAAALLARLPGVYVLGQRRPAPVAVWGPSVALLLAGVVLLLLANPLDALRSAGAVALAGLVTWTVATRLFREFHDQHLALVLERRFPRQLADRLITAVELSDPQKAAEQGYSPAMVEKTIHDAAAEVEKLPVGQVFDWARLGRMAIRMLGVTAALYLLSASLFCMARAFSRPETDVAALLGPAGGCLLAVALFAVSMLVWKGGARSSGVAALIILAVALLFFQNLIPIVMVNKFIRMGHVFGEWTGWGEVLPASALISTLLLGGWILALVLIFQRGKAAALLGVLLIALLALGGAGCLAAGMRGTGGDGLRGVNDFHAASATWADRNLWLKPLPWPRNAQLEIVEPAAPETYVGYDAPNPPLRVRAYVYLTADEDLQRWPTGWRPLLWQDVRQYVPDAPEAPADWTPRNPSLGLTVDEVETRLARLPVRRQGDGWEQRIGARWEPLAWDSLKAKVFTGEARDGGLRMPELDGEWDPKALPVFGTAVIGLAPAPDLGPLTAAVRAAAARPAHLKLTVDEVQGRLKQDAFLKGREKDAAAVKPVLARLRRWVELEQALERLDGRLDDWELARKVRKLTLPQQLVVRSWNDDGSNEMTIDKGADNEYSGAFSNLKVGHIQFQVRGEDFVTDTRRIDVLAAPTLTTLELIQEQPAYLFYRPLEQADPDRLGEGVRSRKQLFKAKNYGGYAGELVEVRVPAGTNVTIKATANKPLQSVRLTPNKGAQMPRDPRDVRIFASDPNRPDDRDSFEETYSDVRVEHSFTLTYVDIYGVTGKRQFKIRPIDDQPPELNEIKPHPAIRHVDKEGYMVTVDARVPFVGTIKDDHGLSKVRYAYSMERIDAGNLVSVEALGLVAMAKGQMAQAGCGLPALTLAVAGGVEAKKPIAPLVNLKGGVQYRPLPLFEARLSEESERAPRPALVADLLRTPADDPYRGDALVKAFSLSPDEWDPSDQPMKPLLCDFPIYQLKNALGKPLKVKEGEGLQPRYRMLLWVEALDTDVDSDKERDGRPRPHLGKSKDNFPFVIVSEKELLIEIGKQEEKIFANLEKVLGELKKVEAKLNELDRDLQQGDPREFNAAALGAKAARLEDFLNALDKGLKECSDEGLEPYKLILEEMKLNQVDPEMNGIRKKVKDTVVDPLTRLTNSEDGNFKKTLESINVLGRELGKGKTAPGGNQAAVKEASKTARKEMEDLVKGLNKILGSMQGLIDIKNLIEILQRLEKDEQQEYEEYKKTYDRLRKKLLDGL